MSAGPRRLVQVAGKAALRGTGRPVGAGVALAFTGLLMLYGLAALMLQADVKTSQFAACDAAVPDPWSEAACDRAKGEARVAVLAGTPLLAAWVAAAVAALVLGATALHGLGRRRALRQQADARHTLAKQWYVDGVLDPSRYEAYRAQLESMQRGDLPGQRLVQAGAGLYTAGVVALPPAAVLAVMLAGAAFRLAKHLPWAPAAILPWALGIAALPVVAIAAGVATRLAGDRSFVPALGALDREESAIMAAARGRART